MHLRMSVRNIKAFDTFYYSSNFIHYIILQTLLATRLKYFMLASYKNPMQYNIFQSQVEMKTCENYFVSKSEFSVAFVIG